MAQENINLGTPPSGSDGDTTRTALQKTQDNFTDLYGQVAANATAASNAQTAANAALPVASIPDYVSGFKLSYISGSSIAVSSGSAALPAGGMLVSTATLTLAGLALTASTHYHVYLYSNAGAPAIECVTTAPDAPYAGTARAKTGDTSRRYLGSIRTLASGAIRPFRHVGTSIDYTDTFTNVLSAGVATTATNVSLAAAVPPTGVAARCCLRNASTSNYATLALPGGTLPANYTSLCSFSTYFTGMLPCDSSQNVAYAMSASGSSGLYIDVTGYQFER